MSYSFDQYHESTEFTRSATGTVHNSIGYALLGCIGELGEVVDSIIISDDISDYESLNVIDKQAITLMQNFLALAQEIEAFKKMIRKKQLTVLEFCEPSEDTKEELGGLYWYTNNLADQCGLSMANVAQANQEMLAARFKANPGWMTNGGVKLHRVGRERESPLASVVG